MVLGYTFESSDLVIFGTLVLLEGVLSFDNAAVLAAMVRRLPAEQRRKALLYGLAGAYTFRVLAILLVAFLIQYTILKLIGGLYLVYLAFKHLAPGTNAHAMEASIMTRLGLSPFWGVVISIELADLVFAIDQVVVAVAMTDKIAIIIAASLVAILFLRLSAAYIARLMDWFPPLERFAYLAVGFVGLKLVSVEIAHMAGFSDFEIPKAITIGTTLTLLVLPILFKLVLDRVKAARATP